MKLVECNQEYAIREFVCKIERSGVTLSWRFKKGTHFLIILSDSRKEYSIETIVNAVPMNDKSLIAGRGWFSEKEHYRVFCIREKEFVQQNKRFVFPTNVMLNDIPYEIKVYVAEYQAENEELNVYLPESDDNFHYMPVAIKPEIEYKKKIFSNQKVCILKVARIAGYTEGAIMYHVSGISSDFPLSEKCLGKELYITIPQNAEVNIRIGEKFKKYYK